MSTPALFPAIDLRAGRCVRLIQGDYDRETVYGEDPVAQALAFQEAGADWVHVVDLDAARTGDPVNRPVVAAVAAALDVPVQTGGGVRSVADARDLFDAGVFRVVLGTAAVEDPDLVTAVADHGPVAVGLDVWGDEVAVRGWTEGSGLKLGDALIRYSDLGAAAFVITRIERDGTLEGPDVDGL
ncbi:MAG: 1-(5-phosphoribosyl)-5-[(5-phosphoribosylamino)methylideneamino] imidazole-4-carboxamide isomerase, partial [Acidimicrobiales bacterium]|nr:1-(5-phosphoribosyl)-5-[(5-phosphoribosylamino)methylideneamino] imidazole-4-carboxamide isomerase [Acidimicrobiales bacterium]